MLPLILAESQSGSSVELIDDPDTGEALGANEMTVGRIQILAVRGPRHSSAISVSGSSYKPGDVLKK